MTAVYRCLGRAHQVPAGSAWLTEAEREVEASFVRAKRRRDWRLGRWTAKQLLAGCFGWREVEIARADDGAPAARQHGVNLPLALTLSHSGDSAWACAGAPTLALGCDIERVEPRSAAFVADFFTDRERALVDDASDRDQMVTIVWSAKESALKALRIGLGRDTRSVEVSVHDHGRLEVEDRNTGVVFRGRWDRHRDYVTTLCFAAAGETAKKLHAVARARTGCSPILPASGL